MCLNISNITYKYGIYLQNVISGCVCFSKLFNAIEIEHYFKYM